MRGALAAGGVSQDRCNSSLGERAPLRQAQCGEQGRTVGCGRWSSALTEPFRLYVRSLTRAPLGRSVKRGRLLSKPKAPVVQVQRTHRSIAFGKRGESPSDAIALGGRSSLPSDPYCLRRERRVPERVAAK